MHYIVTHTVHKLHVFHGCNGDATYMQKVHLTCNVIQYKYIVFILRLTCLYASPHFISQWNRMFVCVPHVIFINVNIG